MTTIEPVKTQTIEQPAFKSKFAEEKAVKFFAGKDKITKFNQEIIKRIHATKNDVKKQLEAYKAYCNFVKK